MFYLKSDLKAFKTCAQAQEYGNEKLDHHLNETINTEEKYQRKHKTVLAVSFSPGVGSQDFAMLSVVFRTRSPITEMGLFKSSVLVLFYDMSLTKLTPSSNVLLPYNRVNYSFSQCLLVE